MPYSSTLGIACDISFATDYPDINPKESGDVSLGKGPILAKGASINIKINALLEKTAMAYNIPIQ